VCVCVCVCVCVFACPEVTFTPIKNSVVLSWERSNIEFGYEEEFGERKMVIPRHHHTGISQNHVKINWIRNWNGKSIAAIILFNPNLPANIDMTEFRQLLFQLYWVEIEIFWCFMFFLFSLFLARLKKEKIKIDEFFTYWIN
jgi:hypothetical protein